LTFENYTVENFSSLAFVFAIQVVLIVCVRLRYSTTGTAAKLHDEALATGKLLEDEAASLRSTNAKRD
jgi:hypothetical protein